MNIDEFDDDDQIVKDEMARRYLHGLYIKLIQHDAHEWFCDNPCDPSDIMEFAKFKEQVRAVHNYLAWGEDLL